MANFKDSYRLERVYFEKLKSMISILKSYLENETDEKTRAILENEIDDNGAILLLYRNLGEAWAELADLIQKLQNDLTELDEKEEAYHDELNERIDEVNNYLMALIRALEARMDAVEADLAQMGRLFTYDLTETSGVYNLTESGTSVTFVDTVSKLTHVRPHFVSVRNGAKYYLIDTYDLTAATGSVTWSGFEFTPAGEIKETIVTLAADNSVTVTQTSTNFASILSRLTAIETKITNFGDLPSNANAAEGDVLTVGANHVNEWKAAGIPLYIINVTFDRNDDQYIIAANPITDVNGNVLSISGANVLKEACYGRANVRIKLLDFYNPVYDSLPVMVCPYTFRCGEYEDGGTIYEWFELGVQVTVPSYRLDLINTTNQGDYYTASCLKIYGEVSEGIETTFETSMLEDAIEANYMYPIITKYIND